jgi:hypothetical protein
MTTAKNTSNKLMWIMGGMIVALVLVVNLTRVLAPERYTADIPGEYFDLPGIPKGYEVFKYKDGFSWRCALPKGIKEWYTNHDRETWYVEDEYESNTYFNEIDTARASAWQHHASVQKRLKEMDQTVILTNP